MKSKLIYSVVLIFLISVPLASADDGFFAGEGETVWPVDSKEIEMVAETVIVKPGITGWDADCIFILKNTGNETVAQVGFPDMVEEGDGADTNKGTIENFRCFVDSEEVQVEHKLAVQNLLKPELNYPFAYIWKMSFKKGQIRKITNTYSFKGIGISDGSVSLIYILKTGSLWKGTIKSAVIEFDLGKFDPELCYSIKPSGYEIEKNKIIWSFSDFEPAEDIDIYFNALVQYWLIQADECLKSDSIQALKDLLDEGLLHWNFYIYPSLNKKFIPTAEKIIKRLKPYIDVKVYEQSLAEREKDLKDIGHK